MEGHQQNHMTNHTRTQEIALYTVPVLFRKGKQQREVNAILDDGSTKTYINANVAAH